MFNVIFRNNDWKVNTFSNVTKKSFFYLKNFKIKTTSKDKEIKNS